MTQYLADLMEDASDFSWHNAKAAHAVLLCEMERGSITWFDTDRIDWVRRAHAQKHSNPQKQNWVKGGVSSIENDGFAKPTKQTHVSIKKTTR